MGQLCSILERYITHKSNINKLGFTEGVITFHKQIYHSNKRLLKITIFVRPLTTSRSLYIQYCTRFQPSIFFKIFLTHESATVLCFSIPQWRHFCRRVKTFVIGKTISKCSSPLSGLNPGLLILMKSIFKAFLHNLNTAAIWLPFTLASPRNRLGSSNRQKMQLLAVAPYIFLLVYPTICLHAFNICFNCPKFARLYSDYNSTSTLRICNERKKLSSKLNLKQPKTQQERDLRQHFWLHYF